MKFGGSTTMAPKGSIARTMLFLLSLNFVMASGSLIDMFSTVCPYSNFCTVNSSKTLPSSSALAPCCLDCFCDDKCAFFGDCCPDIESKGTSKGKAITPLECKPRIVQNEYYVKEVPYLNDINSYRIIDFCPTDNNSERCLWESDFVPDYDDMVVVSDRETGTPYKNKYCAQCHGVTDLVRWDLVIAYCRGIEDAQLLATEVNQFLNENCLITSIPGDDVPYNARTMGCLYDAVSCSDGDAATEVVEKCNNGPIMPYRYERPGFARVKTFKNAFCYQCGVSKEVSFTCDPTDAASARTLLAASYAFLLNMVETDQKPTDEKRSCSDGWKLDTFTNKCRRVYCPPLEAVSQDKCITIAQLVNGIGLTLIYVPEDGVTHVPISDNTVFFYNRSMTNHFILSTNRKLGNEQCKVLEFNTVVNIYKDSDVLQFLKVDITYALDDKCSLQIIRSMIQKASEITETWLIGSDQLLKMNGRVTFYYFDPFRIELESIRGYGLTFYTSGQSDTSYDLQKFFLCPYYVLDIDEYSQVVTRLTKGSSNFNLTTFTSTTDTLQGYYQLSETEIAVCIETYTASLTSGSTQTDASFISHGLVWILVTLDIVGLLSKAF